MNESTISWDHDTGVGMFYTTRIGVFRKVLKRLEPDINFAGLLEQNVNDIIKVESYINSLELETGIQLRLRSQSYAIYNIRKSYQRGPESAFKIRKSKATQASEEAPS